MPTIRILAEADLPAWRALRRQSLVQAPLSFSASPEDDITAAPQGVVFGAFDGDTLAGFVGLLRDAKRKGAHKMHLWGMYVVPSHRGRGVGAALLDAAIAHARGVEGVAAIHLSVTDASSAARRLYERFGFALWGTQPDALRHEGTSVADHHMILRLDPSFHEATVTEFVQRGEDIHLSLDRPAATIVVRGVEEIVIDDERAGSVAMEFADGEVLSLELRPRELELLVVWNDFARRESRTRSYRIRGSAVDVTSREDHGR